MLVELVEQQVKAVHEVLDGDHVPPSGVTW